MEADLLESNSVDIETVESADITLEALTLLETQVADETCSKFGGAALICAGCPMLRFCELKTVAVEEVAPEIPLQAAVDELDVLDVTDSFGVPKTESIPSVTTETSSDSSDSHQADIGKLPESSPAPKPSYLERLLDDDVEVVVADSIVDTGEQSAIPVPVFEDYDTAPIITENTASDMEVAVLYEQDEASVVSREMSQVEVAPKIIIEQPIDTIIPLDSEDKPIRPDQYDDTITIPIFASVEVPVMNVDVAPRPIIDDIQRIASQKTNEVFPELEEKEYLSFSTQPEEGLGYQFEQDDARPTETTQEEIYDDSETVAFEMPSATVLNILDQKEGELDVDSIIDNKDEVSLPLAESVDESTDVYLNQKSDDDRIIAIPIGRIDKPIIDSLDTVEPELRLAAVTSVSAQQTTINTVRNLAIYALKWLRIDEPLRQAPVC